MPPQVECTWIWLGLTVRWQKDSGCPMCPAGTACDPPGYDGGYIGEPGVTGCATI